MKKLYLSPIFLLLLFMHVLLVQQTITITTGSKWMDAEVYKDTRSGFSHIANQNYGT